MAQQNAECSCLFSLGNSDMLVAAQIAIGGFQSSTAHTVPVARPQRSAQGWRNIPLVREAQADFESSRTIDEKTVTRLLEAKKT